MESLIEQILLNIIINHAKSVTHRHRSSADAYFCLYSGSQMVTLGSQVRTRALAKFKIICYN